MSRKTKKNEPRETFSDSVMFLLKMYQFKQKLDDNMMSGYLDVNERTYRNYADHPENIQLKQIDLFLDKNNLSFDELLECCNLFSNKTINSKKLN